MHDAERHAVIPAQRHRVNRAGRPKSPLTRLELSSMQACTIRGMEPDLPPGTNTTRLFEDKTPNALILNRILLNSLNVAAHDDLAPPDGKDLST